MDMLKVNGWWPSTSSSSDVMTIHIVFYTNLVGRPGMEAHTRCS